jgi:hypothetical protein
MMRMPSWMLVVREEAKRRARRDGNSPDTMHTVSNFLALHNFLTGPMAVTSPESPPKVGRGVATGVISQPTPRGQVLPLSGDAVRP